MPITDPSVFSFIPKPAQGGLKQVTLLWGRNKEHILPLNTPWGSPPEQIYNARAQDLFMGVEQDIIVNDVPYGAPQDIRSQLKERTFSIQVTVWGGGSVYDYLYQMRLSWLKKTLFSDTYTRTPLRLVVDRQEWDQATQSVKTFSVYIDCRCEGMKETSPGTFDCKFVAPNPYFTRVSGVNGTSPYGDPALLPPAAQGFTYTLDPGDPDLNNDWITSYTKGENDISFTTGSITYIPTAGADANKLEVALPYAGTAISEPVISASVANSGRVWRYRREFALTNNSSQTFQNQPICVDLGDVTSIASKFNTDFSDIRIETFGGARKFVYVRNTGNNVKVWFVIYSLAPGETKYFRLLYTRNTNIVADAENSAVKPMFQMWQSTNSQWIFNDFAPRYDQPQSRVCQWQPHIPGANNISYIQTSQNDFGPPADNTLVPCAAGQTAYHGTGAGYAGRQLVTACRISNVVYTSRTRTTYKAPLVRRSLIDTAGWKDEPDDATSQRQTGNRTYSAASYGGGATVIATNTPSLTNAGWQVGDAVGYWLYKPSNPLAWTTNTVDAIDSPAGSLTLHTAIPTGWTLLAGYSLWQYPTGLAFSSQTIDYTGVNCRGVMFGMRVDYPNLALGEWYYAGAETATINFVTADVPTILWRAGSVSGNFTSATFLGGFEFDMDTAVAGHGYQLIGHMVNGADSTSIRFSTVLAHYNDRLVIDCQQRTCTYYEWDNTNGVYKAGVNWYESMYFDTVRDYWFQLYPGQDTNALQFIAEPNSNFTNLNFRVTYPVRYF